MESLIPTIYQLLVIQWWTVPHTGHKCVKYQWFNALTKSFLPDDTMSLTAAKLEAKRGLVVLLLRTHFHLLIVTQLCPEHTLGVLKSLNFETLVKQKKIANSRKRLVFSTSTCLVLKAWREYPTANTTSMYVLTADSSYYIQWSRIRRWVLLVFQTSFHGQFLKNMQN